MDYNIQDYMRHDAKPDSMTLSQGILAFFLIGGILFICVAIAA